MAELALTVHPDGTSAIQAIGVALVRPDLERLQLAYRVSGVLDRLAVPTPQPPGRADELWKHTCFEVFIGAANGYYEFNFSPSSQWAAYRFDDYRTGMRDAVVAMPAIEWSIEEGRATLFVTLELSHDATGPLGLSAVIEDPQGARSFWALAHPAGPPDFHHAACFAAELPSAG